MSVTVEFPNPAQNQHMQSETGMRGLRTSPAVGKIKCLRGLAGSSYRAGNAGYPLPELIVVAAVAS